MIDLIQVFGICGLIFAFGFPFVLDKKGKTWFKGYGQCDYLNGCYFGHAKPRPEFRLNCKGETSWYCDSHYQETLALGRMVDKLCNKEISNDQFWAWRNVP